MGLLKYSMDSNNFPKNDQTTGFFFFLLYHFLWGTRKFSAPPHVNILTKQSLEAESLRKQSLEAESLRKQSLKALINGLQQNHNCVKVLETVTKI